MLTKRRSFREYSPLLENRSMANALPFSCIRSVVSVHFLTNHTFPSFPSADGNQRASRMHVLQCSPSNASLEQKLLVVSDDEFHPITWKSVTRSMQRVMAVKTVVRQTCFGKYLRQQHDASQTTKRCSENKTFSRTLSCRIRVDDCRFYVRHLLVCLHPALS